MRLTIPRWSTAAESRSSDIQNGNRRALFRAAPVRGPVRISVSKPHRVIRFGDTHAFDSKLNLHKPPGRDVGRVVCVEGYSIILPGTESSRVVRSCAKKVLLPRCGGGPLGRPPQLVHCHTSVVRGCRRSKGAPLHDGDVGREGDREGRIRGARRGRVQGDFGRACLVACPSVGDRDVEDGTVGCVDLVSAHKTNACAARRDQSTVPESAANSWTVHKGDGSNSCCEGFDEHELVVDLDVPLQKLARSPHKDGNAGRGER
mmetsp:Transcript_26868/g.67802  ORF Transcript_26868/g.67802 Transcript_26868/m.67802 type:complete len:260 (-) Transcript_26868:415-1194(-)